MAARALNIFVDFPSRARVSKKYVHMVCAENTADFSRPAYNELHPSKSSFGNRECWMRCFGNVGHERVVNSVGTRCHKILMLSLLRRKNSANANKSDVAR